MHAVQWASSIPVEEALIMAPNLLLYQLLVVALLLISLLVHGWWPDKLRGMPQPPLASPKPRRKRSKDPKPVPGLIPKPLCEACEQGAEARLTAPSSPPPLITCARGRRRTVDTHAPFCPAPNCASHGWRGRGTLRAHGPPGSQPWRQFQCVSGHGDLDETHGTLLQGQRSSPERIGRVVA